VSNYEFGIGITVDPASVSTAADTIGGVITDFENSLTSMAGVDLSQIFGSFDPTLLMPNNDAIEESAATLREIAGILSGIAGIPVAESLEGTPEVLAEVDEDLQEVAKDMCGVTTCVEEVDEGLQEVARSTDAWGSKLKAVSGFAASAADQGRNIGKAADLLMGSASQLEHVSVRMEASLGKGRDAAEDFGTTALKTANRNMITVESAAKLQLELRRVGVAFDGSTTAGREQIDTMSKLTASFGMSEAEAASLAGTMKATGTNMTKMTGIAVHFQKKFNVPGLLNELPKAAKGAMAAQANFGSLVGRSTKDISTSVLRMAGVYSNALGVTAAEAADKALGTFQKFTAEIESYEDLFLGLSDSFSPLQTAFLETGMGMEDLQDLMKKGQEDPAAFAEEVKRIRDSMDPQMGQRFFRQVLRNTDEATKALLTQEAAAAEANKVTAGVGAEEPENPAAVFNEVADAMRKNSVDAVEMHKALKGVTVEMAKFAASEGIGKGMMAANKVIQGTNDVLIQQWDELRKNDEMMAAFTNTIAGTTGGLVLLNDAIGAFNKITATGGTILVGIASGIGLLFKPFTKLIKFLRGTGTAAGPGARGAGGALKGFGKLLGKIALPIGIAIAAFDNVVDAIKDIGAIMSDPSKSGMDKFKGVVKSVLGAVWGTFSDFFLGLPQMFVDGFMNVGKVVDTSGSESMGKAIGSILGKVLKSIVDFFTGLPETFGTGWDNLTAWWDSLSIYDDIMLPIVSGFASMGDHILGFLGGALEGVLEAFGMTSDSAASTVDALGTIISVTFTETFAWVYKVLEDAGDYFLFFISGIQKGWSWVVQGLKVGLELFKGAWNVTFAGLEFVAIKIFTGVVAGVAGMGKGLLEGLQTALGGIESIVNNLPDKVLKMMGLEGGLDLTSGIDSQIAALDRLDDKMGEMADAAQARVVAEATGTAARINAINEAGRTEREEITRNDAIRLQGMDARQAAYDKERQQRAQTMGKAVDVLFGADPNAEANAARALAQEKEVSDIRAARHAADVAAAEKVMAINASIKTMVDTANASMVQAGLAPTMQYNFMPMPEPTAPTSGATVAPSVLAGRAGGTGAPGGSAAGALGGTAGAVAGGTQRVEVVLSGGDEVTQTMVEHANVTLSDQGGQGNR